MAPPDRRYDILEARVRVLEQEVSRLRDWRHEWSGEMTPVLAALEDLKSAVIENRPKYEHETGERRHLTMRDLYVYVGGITTILALLKLLGKI